MAFLYILFFILGNAVGSFLNVVIDRVTFRQTIFGRSYCDFCRAKLKVFDLVPIFSFLFLSGRCRYCRRPLSLQYPLVETTVGVLFVLTYVAYLSGFGSILSLVVNLFFVSVMVVVAVVDFKFSLIPTSFVFLASIVSLFYNYFAFSSSVFVEHAIAAFAAAIFFALIVILSFGRGMGIGDVFLAFLMGMILGKNVILAIFLAFLIGAVISSILLLLGKKHFGQTVPFAPFLVLGFFISLFFAQPIINWYLMLY